MSTPSSPQIGESSKPTSLVSPLSLNRTSGGGKGAVLAKPRLGQGGSSSSQMIAEVEMRSQSAREWLRSSNGLGGSAKLFMEQSIERDVNSQRRADTPELNALQGWLRTRGNSATVPQRRHTTDSVTGRRSNSWNMFDKSRNAENPDLIFSKEPAKEHSGLIEVFTTQIIQNFVIFSLRLFLMLGIATTMASWCRFLEEAVCRHIN